MRPESSIMAGKYMLITRPAVPSLKLAGKSSSLEGSDAEGTDSIDGDAELPSPQEKPSPDVLRVLKGATTNLPSYPTNVVRIFLSSTFSDFKAERTVLLRDACPKLQQFCAEKGMDFQVVDMRWGVTQEMINDHLVSDLCLREIDVCRRISNGPFFVTLVGQRYGYQPIPSNIDAAELELLVSIARELKVEGEETLKAWYKKDENAVPPEYCLQPIDSRLPHFISHDASESSLQETAANEWDKQMGIMRTFLRTGAVEAVRRGQLSELKKDAYFVSATAEEIHHGLAVAEEKMQGAMCYFRNFQVSSTQQTAPLSGKYVEHDSQTNQLMSIYSRDHVLKRVPSEQCREYKVDWTGTPLERSEEQGHRKYFENFAADFYNDLKSQIEVRAASEEITTQRGQHIGLSYSEALHHAKFCEERCKTYCCRGDVETRIQQYLTFPKEGNPSGYRNQPLIVHGQSGCGKSSLLAYVARMAPTWLNNDAITVIRFFGTSPESSGIIDVLVSVLRQLSLDFDKPMPSEEDYRSMGNVRRLFWKTLEDLGKELLESGKCLVFVLDSVDQLQENYGAHHMLWMPKDLPPSVFMVISMLDDRYMCFENTRRRLTSEGSFLELSSLPAATGIAMMTTYLQQHDRALTYEQQMVVQQAFTRCRQPLFLRLILREAATWKSYQAIPVTPSDTQAAVDGIFSGLEVLYGLTFVTHALGLMSAGRGGLTTLEVEDALSLDDGVLQETYRYHDPPIEGVIRVPPLLWARLQYGLEEFFVERQVDGKTVLAWHHRLFSETAQHRFLKNPSIARKLHGILAEMFSHDNGIKRSVTLPQRGNKLIPNADRQVSLQPLATCNVRRLNCQPYHLWGSGDVGTLLFGCYYDFPWLLTKVTACGVHSVLAELSSFLANRRNGALLEARKEGLNSIGIDEAIESLKLMKKFMQLCVEALRHDPSQLAYQVLERLRRCDMYTPVKNLIGGAHKWIATCGQPLLLPAHPLNFEGPDSPQEFSLLAGNHGQLTSNCKYFVGGWFDKRTNSYSVKLWHLEDLDLIESFPTIPLNPYVVSQVEPIVAFLEDGNLRCFNVESGDHVRDVNLFTDRNSKVDVRSMAITKDGSRAVLGIRFSFGSRGKTKQFANIYVADCLTNDVRELSYFTSSERRLPDKIFFYGKSEDRFVVVDFVKVSIYDWDTLQVLQVFREVRELGGEMFRCFGPGAVGPAGGHTDDTARIVIFNFESDGANRVVKSKPIHLNEEEQARAFSVSCLRKNDKDFYFCGVSTLGKNKKASLCLWCPTDEDQPYNRMNLDGRGRRNPKIADFCDSSAVGGVSFIAVVGWDDGRLSFIDLASKTPVFEIQAHQMVVNTLLFAKPGMWYSVAGDHRLRAWNLKSVLKAGKRSRIASEQEMDDAPSVLDENEQVVAFTATNYHVVTVRPEPWLPPRFWNLADGTYDGEVNAKIEGEYEKIYRVTEGIPSRKEAELIWLPKKNVVVDIRKRRIESTVHVIDYTFNRIVAVHKAGNPVQVTEDGRLMTCTDGNIQVWDLMNCVLIRMIPSFSWSDALKHKMPDATFDLQLTTDDKCLVYADLVAAKKYFHTLHLDTFDCTPEQQVVDWKRYMRHGTEALMNVSSREARGDSDSHRCLFVVPDPARPRLTRNRPFRVIKNRAFLSADFVLAASICNDTEVRIWRTATLSHVVTLKNRELKVQAVALNSQKMLAAVGMYHLVKLWDLASGALLYSFDTFGAVNKLSFASADDSTLYLLVHCYSGPKKKRVIVHKLLNR